MESLTSPGIFVATFKNGKKYELAISNEPGLRAFDPISTKQILAMLDPTKIKKLPSLSGWKQYTEPIPYEKLPDPVKKTIIYYEYLDPIDECTAEVDLTSYAPKLKKLGYTVTNAGIRYEQEALGIFPKKIDPQAVTIIDELITNPRPFLV